MRRHRLGALSLIALIFAAGVARAQNSIDILEEELKTAKQQQEDMTTQNMTNFFSQVDAAMGSPDAAVNLYQQAGGVMPDPSPVITEHESETNSERETRLALDQSNLTKLGLLLQLHCGLMHFAATFVVNPKQAGLQDQWVNWLQHAAPIYTQMAPLPDGVIGGAQNEPVHRKKRDRDGEGANAAPEPPRPPPPTLNLTELKAKSVQDSIISKYLSFKSWGSAEQGGWAVGSIPSLYQSNVLTPLRTPPTAATLAAWDVYIAMLNADETDNNRWNTTINPPLQFERACDDYAIAPSTEKLEGLINIYKANATFPGASDWHDRIEKMLADYRAQHGEKPAADPNAPATGTPAPAKDPNVTVSTEQQGDMTIIITHTNSTATPAPPAH